MRFEVSLSRHTHETGTIVVDAEDEEEAHAIVEEMDQECDIEDWRVQSITSEIESVEEVD